MAPTASADTPAHGGGLPLELDLDDEQQLLLDSTRGFLGRHYPVSAAREVIEAERPADPEGWRQAAEMGWIAVLAPEAFGGLGGSPAEATVVASELGRAVNWTPFLGCALSAAVLSGGPGEGGGPGAAAPGTPAGDLLGRLVGGESTAAWCGPEPRGGEWGAAGIRAEAAAAGDGYELSGEKRLVADADLAGELVVSARLDGRLSTFVLPADAPGVEVVPSRTLDLTRRFPTVRLDRVRVDAGALAGEPGAAGDAVAYGLDLGTVLTCADAVGAAERLMEMTVEYAMDRIAFQRPIASYQAVKHKCADMLLQVEAARAATRYAALTIATGHADREKAVAVAGSYVSEAAPRVAGEALQIHGGVGFTWEHDLHLYLRRIKADEVLFGDASEHLRRVAEVTL